MKLMEKRLGELDMSKQRLYDEKAIFVQKVKPLSLRIHGIQRCLGAGEHYTSSFRISNPKRVKKRNGSQTEAWKNLPYFAVSAHV
jgi:hypothetical protein